MIPVGDPCPDCDEPLPQEAFYETAKDEMSGMYKCPHCGRNTGWQDLTGINCSFAAFAERILGKLT